MDLSLKTEFYGTVVGRQPQIIVFGDGNKCPVSEIICVDITSYILPDESHEGQHIMLAKPVGIQFLTSDYQDADCKGAEYEKVLNGMSVGTEISFRVQHGTCENVKGVNTEVGFKITSIRIVGHKRLNLGEYLYALRKERGNV